MKALTLTLAVALVAGCAHTGQNYRPIVDTTSERYEQDLRECQAFAAQRMDAAQGAAAGALLGALLGAVLSRAAGGSGNRGAATGAVAGGTAFAGQAENSQRSIIKRCLTGRGYSVLE